MLKWIEVEPSASGTPLPVVVSYFTDQFYLREAFELVRSCQAFRVDYHVEEQASQGGWLENTNYKPSFLRKVAKLYPKRAIVWLDADARLRGAPDLFRYIFQPIAFRTFGRSPASGTVFLAPGPLRDSILAQWVREVEKHPDATDQVCLGFAMDELKLMHRELPLEYCSIFDFSSENKRLVAPDPSFRRAVVIEHMQASRWARRMEATTR